MPLSQDWLQEGGSTTMFGHDDWMALRRRGITSAQQLARLHDNQQYLAAASGTHRGNKRDTPFLDPWPATGRNTGGLFEQIREHAQREARPWSKTRGVHDWDYNIWGGKGFGKRDVDAAIRRGASPYQLKQLYDRAGQLGIRRDNPDAQRVGVDQAPESPWDFGAHGWWGFGKKDLEAMEAQGWDLDQVKGAKQFAQDQKLNIDPSIDPWILRKQGERDDEVDWRTNMLQPLKDEVADLTAQINEPVEKPGVGYSAPSVVGKSGTRSARLETSRRGSRGGIRRWKRSSWSMPTVNTGNTSGKSSNNPPVNI